MFVKLLKIGYSSKLLKVMTDMYSKASSSVKWKGYLSKSFKDIMGVTQEGITSPFLFKSFLADLGEHLSDECGIILCESIVKHLLWADDLFLVSPSATLMQTQLNNLKDYCSKWHLVVNALKTKILVFGVKDPGKFKFTFGNNAIETSGSYTYLGNLIRDSRNPFTKIDEVILHKCYKACYKIRDYVDAVGQLIPSHAVHFFNVLIAPLLDYGSEVWYSEGTAEKLEVFQKKYFKRNLSVRINTPDEAVFGELGVLPVSVRLKKNLLKFMHRLNTLPNSSLVKWAYSELVTLHELGYDTWYSKASKVMSEFVSIAGLDDGCFLKLNSSSVKAKLDRIFLTEYSKKWLNNINNSDICKKLRTYKLFKSEFKFEKYLDIPSKSVRAAISRFRMSSHHLPIELGRHHKQIIPAEKRLCKKCQVVGNEIHHLLECKITQSIREVLLKAASKYIVNFRSLSKVNQFSEIMSCKEREFLLCLGNFLIEADHLIKDPVGHTP